MASLRTMVDNDLNIMAAGSETGLSNRKRNVNATGTSEGATKAWDTRGRGKAAEQASSSKQHAAAMDYHAERAQELHNANGTVGSFPRTPLASLAEAHQRAADAHSDAAWADPEERKAATAAAQKASINAHDREVGGSYAHPRGLSNSSTSSKERRH